MGRVADNVIHEEGPLHVCTDIWAIFREAGTLVTELGGPALAQRTPSLLGPDPTRLRGKT